MISINETTFYYIGLYEKAKRVVTSCTTISHIKAAKQYCHLFLKVTEDFEYFTDLYYSLTEIERKLVSAN